MTRTIFTEEVMASIPGMVAQGLSDEQIAALIGTTVSSLKVRCSQNKISLRRPRRERVVKPNPLKEVEAKPLTTRMSSIIIEVKVDPSTLNLIALRAEKQGTTIDAVTEKLLRIVARDNLYDAVIDEV